LTSHGVPPLGASNKGGVGKTSYFRANGADGCCITSNKSLICLQLAFMSNWNNFRHPFASRGFVSVSWAFLLFNSHFYGNLMTAICFVA